MIWLDKFIAFGHLDKLQTICFWSVALPIFQLGVYLAYKLDFAYILFAPFLVLILCLIFWSNKLYGALTGTYIVIWLSTCAFPCVNYKLNLKFSIPMWLYPIFIIMAILWIYLYNKKCIKPEDMSEKQYLILCTLMHRIDDYLLGIITKQELFDYAEYTTKKYKNSIPDNYKDSDILYMNEGISWWKDNNDLISRVARFVIAYLNESYNCDDIINARNVLANKLNRKERDRIYYSIPVI